MVVLGKDHLILNSQRPRKASKEHPCAPGNGAECVVMSGDPDQKRSLRSEATTGPWTDTAGEGVWPREEAGFLGADLSGRGWNLLRVPSGMSLLPGSSHMQLQEVVRRATRGRRGGAGPAWTPAGALRPRQAGPLWEDSCSGLILKHEAVGNR